ncbi:MAG: magnesium-translocating P-type ATPase [Bacteroidota bacterium]
MPPTSQSPKILSFWSLSAEATLLEIQSATTGLTEDSAEQRLKQYGFNRLKGRSRASALILFLLQFKSPITLLLVGAAGLSLALHDTTNSIIIFVIVLISSMLGWWQERGAASAVDQLMKMVQINCRVVRNEKEVDISLEKVVPGDVVVLAAGDVIPGDSLLLESKELFVDEAAFTGETYPVEKNSGIVLPIDTPLSKRSNSVLMGSHVISGKARALVVTTARNTEFGKISDRLRTKVPETDFERGIRHFGYFLMEITLVLVVIIFAINVLLDKPVLDSFLFSLALAVGLTPQLLPAIISVNLAAGAKAMANQQVIVKKLSSIENFGSMNILCSDKTGTITKGKVELHNALYVTGEVSEKAMTYAWLNATLQQGFRNPIDEAIALAQPKREHGYEVQSEVPYDFIRKRLTIQIRNQLSNIAITKGALIQVLEVCSQVELPDGSIVPVEEKRSEIIELYTRLSGQGYRTLGVAYKTAKREQDFTREDEKEMILLGVITLFDPPKPDVQETIASLRKLGVQLKIITGDNALVAESIARQIGVSNPKILTGPAMRKIGDEALIHQVMEINIFAEVEPDQKERIILSLKKGGNVVGFLGDGINDAAALHCADVGISVDSAVDVAKEAADIVLLNRDLKVLEQGILEGRKTFANTMKYVFMATSANFGNMFSMAGASVFLSFLPLLPKQILLTNLLTDLPETTISKDRIDNVSIEKPHRWDIRFIQRFMITFGLLSSLFDFVTFGVLHYVLHADEKLFQTGWFFESVISASLIVLVIRTRLPFFKSLPGKYLTIATIAVVAFVAILPFTPLHELFGFVELPLLFYEWILIIVAVYIIAAEYTKQWFYKKWSEQQFTAS